MRNIDNIDISSVTPKHGMHGNPSSPTAVIDSVHRPKSTRSPDIRRTVSPEKPKRKLLAAERFPQSPPVIEGRYSPASARIRSVSSDRGMSPGRRRPRERGSPSARSRSCSTPTRADMQDLMRRVKEVQSKAAAFSYEARCEPKDNETPTEIKVPRKKNREAKETESEDKPGVIETCVRNVAETTVAIYRHECLKNQADHRGDDKDFFMNSATDDESTLDDIREKGSISSLSSTLSPPNPADTFRASRGAMRFPEAINIMDDSAPPRHGPRQRKDRSRRRRRNSEEEDRKKRNEENEIRAAVSPTLEIVAAGEDPESMRQLRLQLFRKDDETRTVPKARLSRALGELVMQDDTIENIQAELEKTKSALEEAEREIDRQKSASLPQSKDDTISPGTNAKTKSEEILEAKLKKWKDENSRLHSKISDHQIEMTHLQTELRKSRVESEEKMKRMVDRQDELQAKLDISEAKLRVRTQIVERPIERPPDSPMVISLRADIASLRAQLVEARTELRKANERGLTTSSESHHVALKQKLIRQEREIQELRSKSAGIPELARLKSRLQRVENEQQNEREGKIPMDSRATSAGRENSREAPRGLSEILRLRTKLHRTENDLKDLQAKTRTMRQAHKEREEHMREELNKAKKDLEELLTRINMAEREIAEEKGRTQAELNASREENTKLKAEIKQLKKELPEIPWDQNGDLPQETRKQLEEELKKSKETELSMSRIISTLNKRVDKAEAEAKEAKAEVERLSNLAKQQDSRQLVEGNEDETPEKKAEENNEDELIGHIHALKSVLEVPKENADDAAADAKSGSKEKKDASLRQEVDQLRNRMLELIELEKRSLEKEDANKAEDLEADHQEEIARLKSMLESQNISLQNEVDVLRFQLKESEEKYMRERTKAKEEHKQRKRMEAEQLKELNTLKMQIIESKVAEKKDSVDHEALEQWKTRLKRSEEEVAQLKAKASEEAKQKEVTIRRLNNERALTTARLVSMRKAKAARGDESSTMDSSLSMASDVSRSN